MRELQASRRLVPEVLQFYGMELNMPAMDHHTLIIPNTEDEWNMLFNIESQFDANEAWPRDPPATPSPRSPRARVHERARRLPLMFANHPSRSATGIGQYGLERAARVPQQQRPGPGHVPGDGRRARAPGRDPGAGRDAEAGRRESPRAIGGPTGTLAPVRSVASIR